MNKRTGVIRTTYSRLLRPNVVAPVVSIRNLPHPQMPEYLSLVYEYMLHKHPGRGHWTPEMSLLGLYTYFVASNILHDAPNNDNRHEPRTVFNRAYQATLKPLHKPPCMASMSEVANAILFPDNIVGALFLVVVGGRIDKLALEQAVRNNIVVFPIRFCPSVVRRTDKWLLIGSWRDIVASRAAGTVSEVLSRQDNLVHNQAQRMQARRLARAEQLAKVRSLKWHNRAPTLNDEEVLEDIRALDEDQEEQVEVVEAPERAAVALLPPQPAAVVQAAEVQEPAEAAALSPQPPSAAAAAEKQVPGKSGPAQQRKRRLPAVFNADHDKAICDFLLADDNYKKKEKGKEFYTCMKFSSPLLQDFEIDSLLYRTKTLKNKNRPYLEKIVGVKDRATIRRMK
ncbi:hypothetical protein TKK_0005289 [Trichogramma kaykai]